MNDPELAKKRAEFFEQCKAHDLTFEHSDDSNVYWRGRASLQKIFIAAKALPRATAVQVWNDVVDLKLVEDVRKDYYWQQ